MQLRAEETGGVWMERKPEGGRTEMEAAPTAVRVPQLAVRSRYLC